jgi:tetratricopeptide (TPR) repeat protein
VEAGTYAPAIISVAVKLAAYQKPSMEEADLRTTLRTALAAAETSRDDGVKAAMSLKLVGALAEPATADEARHFLDYAKAAVARLPASRRLAADVAYAEAMLAGVSDMSASIEPRRRASELRIAEFGERSREARATMRSLAAALESTSPEEAGRLLARLDAIDAEDSVPGSKEALGKRSGKLLEDAIRLVFANDLDGAIRAMSESAEITERVTPGAEGLPVTYQQVATLELFALHYEPALAHFNKAIAMWDKRDVRSPLLAASLYNAATAARELERLDEAIALARRGIAIGTELHAGNPTTLSRAELGRSLVDAGDMTGGRDELDKVVIELAKSAGTSVRATSKFALAVAIWGGSAADHTRALDLGRGARAELADLMARQTTQFGQIQLMTMKRELARIDKWLQTHH